MDYFNGINLFTICTWKGYLSDVTERKNETKKREKISAQIIIIAIINMRVEREYDIKNRFYHCLTGPN